MRRGEIWWASLPAASASGPGSRRPVVVVQTDPFNASRIGTVIVAVVTSNLELGAAPGNVRLGRRESGLKRDSVVNVSQLFTLDKAQLTKRARALAPDAVRRIEAGMRVVLGL